VNSAFDNMSVSTRITGTKITERQTTATYGCRQKSVSAG